MTKLVQDEPFYDVLKDCVGKLTIVQDWDGKKMVGKLSVYRAANGNEGWMIGDFPDGPYTIFAGSVIDSVTPCLFGPLIRL